MMYMFGRCIDAVLLLCPCIKLLLSSMSVLCEKQGLNQHHGDQLPVGNHPPWEATGLRAGHP